MGFKAIVRKSLMEMILNLLSPQSQHRRRFVVQRTSVVGLLALLILFAAAATHASTATESEASANASPEPFDPWNGMDRNGRIPSVAIPDGVKNPDRWRYLPEARIKPGNFIDRLFVTSFVAPYVFRNSDVGTGGGLAATDIDFRGQRRREFVGAFASYTSEGQQSYGVIWERWMNHLELPGGGVLIEDRSFWRSRVSYSKTLTRRFFGLGPKSREQDEASYTDELVWLEFGFERTLPTPGSDWIVGLVVRGEFHELSGGKVGGTLEVADLDADLFRDAKHDDLGRLLGLLRYDTRDSPVNAYRGWMLSGEIDSAPVQSDGDAGSVFRLLGTWVHPVPGLFHAGGGDDEENPPTDTFGVGFRTELTAGDMPFFALPTVGGGEDLRGFVVGRFRDRAAWTAGAEYRVWFIPRGFRVPYTEGVRVERIGAAFFYDVGAVAGNGGDLFDVKVRHSYGIGLRIMLERTAPFRLDAGFSEEGFEFSAGFGFSF